MGRQQFVNYHTCKCQWWFYCALHLTAFYLLVGSTDYAAFPLQPCHSILSNPVKREPVVVSGQFVFWHQWNVFLLDVSYLQVGTDPKSHLYTKFGCWMRVGRRTWRDCTQHSYIQIVPDAYPAFVPGVKRPEPVADHSPHSSAEIRKACVYFCSRTYFLLIKNWHQLTSRCTFCCSLEKWHVA